MEGLEMETDILGLTRLTSVPRSTFFVWGWPHCALLERLPSLCSVALAVHSSSSSVNSHQFIWQQQHTCGAVKAEWTDNPIRLRIFIPDTDTPRNDPPKESPGPALQPPHRGVGRFRSCLYKWSMASSVAGECGAEEQTVDHVVLQCPIHRPPHGLHGLTVLYDETTEWLLNTCPDI